MNLYKLRWNHFDCYLEVNSSSQQIFKLKKKCVDKDELLLPSSGHTEEPHEPNNQVRHDDRI